MRTRTYTDAQCDLMAAEFTAAIEGCDNALSVVYQLLELTYDSEDARTAQDALIRLRAKAEHARSIWKGRKGSQAG
jgi:hypothetical protein